MTITSTPPLLDLAAWDAFTASHGEQRYELVRGVPVMSPGESPVNTTAAVALCRMLDAALMPRWKAVPQLQVDLSLSRSGLRRTVRVPDVALLQAGADRFTARHDAVVVPLVVEIVSPSSVEIDWLVKREEYAAAGIPHYLVIDPRGDHPRMALFTQITAGRYADPHPDGTRATLSIDGTTLSLRLADILTW